jgi:FkbM family methyltransferase
VVEVLERNVSLWSERATAPVTVRRVAVSDRPGAGTLTIPEGDSWGLASLEASSGVEVDVEVVRLSDEVKGEIGVFKLDVEGHELAVLRGAGPLLERRLVRDLVFEEHDSPPTAVTDVLQASGYTIFRLEQGILGPRLVSDLATTSKLIYDPGNYLATRDPDRAGRLFARRGYACLRPRRGRR